MNTYFINKMTTPFFRTACTLLVAGCLLGQLTGCTKKDELIIDRVVSPVLIMVSSGAFSPAEEVVLSATILELDKSGILNHQVGIDSIPVANLPMSVSVAGGAKIADVTTNPQGVLTITKSWPELGLATPVKGNSLNLEWKGEYKGQPFLKLSKVQVK
jgi:hypothetical protein